MKIAIADYGDTKVTGETLGIVSAVFDEAKFDDDNIEYVHMSRSADSEKLAGRGFDVILAMGAEATKILCQTDIPLKKYAGSLTWNDDLGSWVLPTMHPNRIYAGAYGDFDITYDHIHRAVDLATGKLAFPPTDGAKVDWEFVGHNGTRGREYKGEWDPNLWAGYFECTPEEEDRQAEILGALLTELDSGEGITFGADTESFTIDHFYPLTMVQLYVPHWEKAFAFTWGVIERLLDAWRRLFNHENARFVWHNLAHDAKMLFHWMDIRLDDARHDDTMCWAMGLTEKGNQTGLKYNSRQFCNAPFYEEALDEWLTSGHPHYYGHIRPDVLAEYGCLDVFYTHQLSSILPARVEREGTASLVRDTLLPAARTFWQLAYPGIRVDQELGERLSAEWGPKIDAAIEKVQQYAAEHGFPKNPDVVKGQVYREICPCGEAAGAQPGDYEGLRVLSYRKMLRDKYGYDEPCDDCHKKRYLRKVDTTMNVHSWAQMQHFCFDVLGDMEQTWEGRKTNKYFWEINQAHEFAQLVAEYRELDYLHRNIVKGFAKFIRADGRVHPDFLLFGTTTGRLAVRNPAMQTVPAHSETAKPVKRLFLPDPGDLIVNVDYSNLEMYMAHHLTKDDALLQALQQDIHRTTAAAMYMKLYEEVNAEERQSAKPVNFGAGYNIKAKKLSRDKNLVKITEGESSKAQEFLDAFWGTYQTWDTCRKQWVEDALENCELYTEMGRKRRWSLITKDNKWKVENQACNFQGQSMASDLCLRSLITLQHKLSVRGWGRVLMTVHDSIVFSVHPQYIHQAVRLIKRVMTTPPFETTTPFKVDVTVGPNYGDQYDYDPEGVYVRI